METISFRVASRSQLGKTVKRLRATSLIPGVVYGHGVDNRFVTAEAVPFSKLLAKAGESSLVDLAIDDAAPVKVLIHDVQRDPVTHDVKHIDFYQVNMSEKISAHVPLTITGESSAVKGLGGVLVKALDHVTVTCLPQDLVHELTIDIGKLVQFDDAIRVSDLVAPTGITIEGDPHEVIVTVKAPRTEEELKADLTTPATENVAEVEVEKKGKKEEEAAAESAKE